MLDLSNYIKTDLNSARDQFLNCCNAIGLRVNAYAGVGTGTLADDEPIYADVALAGSPDAPCLLVLAPADGMSGFMASAMVSAFLREKIYLELPRHVACLLIHAINPKGPIWPPFSLIQDNHPLPPAKDWGNHLLVNAEASYEEDKKSRYQGVLMDRLGLASLPLSAMAMPGWDEDVIRDIEQRFLQDRQQISLIDFRDDKTLTRGVFDVGYCERSIIGEMGNLNDCLDGDLSKIQFDDIASAGLIDQAGQHANILQIKTNIVSSSEGTIEFSAVSDIIRRLINQMPKD